MDLCSASVQKVRGLSYILKRISMVFKNWNLRVAHRQESTKRSNQGVAFKY